MADLVRPLLANREPAMIRRIAWLDFAELEPRFRLGMERVVWCGAFKFHAKSQTLLGTAKKKAQEIVGHNYMRKIECWHDNDKQQQRGPRCRANQTL